MRSARDGVYTIGQARRGVRSIDLCAPCHGFDLEGGLALPLVGPEFTKRWDGRTIGELFELVQINFVAMNTKRRVTDPEGLSRGQSADFVAYLLLQNRFPGGPSELPAGLDLLKQTRIEFSRR